MDGGTRRRRNQRQPPCAAEELSRKVPNGNGHAVSSRHDREPGAPDQVRTRFGMEIRMGTGSRRFSGEASELVREVFERERRDTTVEELGDAR